MFELFLLTGLGIVFFMALKVIFGVTGFVLNVLLIPLKLLGVLILCVVFFPLVLVAFPFLLMAGVGLVVVFGFMGSLFCWALA